MELKKQKHWKITWMEPRRDLITNNTNFPDSRFCYISIIFAQLCVFFFFCFTTAKGKNKLGFQGGNWSAEKSSTNAAHEEQCRHCFVCTFADKEPLSIFSNPSASTQSARPAQGGI